MARPAKKSASGLSWLPMKLGRCFGVAMCGLVMGAAAGSAAEVVREMVTLHPFEVFEYNWTFEMGGYRFGVWEVVGTGRSEVWFGTRSMRVPVPAPALALAFFAAPLLVAGGALMRAPSRKPPRARGSA